MLPSVKLSKHQMQVLTSSEENEKQRGGQGLQATQTSPKTSLFTHTNVSKLSLAPLNPKPIFLG